MEAPSLSYVVPTVSRRNCFQSTRPVFIPVVAQSIHKLSLEMYTLTYSCLSLRQANIDSCDRVECPVIFSSDFNVDQSRFRETIRAIVVSRYIMGYRCCIGESRGGCGTDDAGVLAAACLVTTNTVPGFRHVVGMHMDVNCRPDWCIRNFPLNCDQQKYDAFRDYTQWAMRDEKCHGQSCLRLRWRVSKKVRRLGPRNKLKNWKCYA